MHLWRPDITRGSYGWKSISSSAATAAAGPTNAAHRPGLTADKITSAHPVQFLFAEVAALKIHPFPGSWAAFNDDISRVAHNTCTHVCTYFTPAIQFHEGCNVFKTYGERKRKIKWKNPIFKPIFTGICICPHVRFNTNTCTRDLRTCVAVKPQKLFFLDNVIPLALSREGEAAAGANANATLTPLECNCVATENVHACCGRTTRVATKNEPTIKYSWFQCFKS